MHREICLIYRLTKYDTRNLPSLSNLFCDALTKNARCRRYPETTWRNVINKAADSTLLKC